MINLRPKVRAATSKPAVINASLAAIPKPAVAAYHRGVALGKAGEASRAVDQLKLALSLYPEFGLALSELGDTARIV